MHCSVAQVCMLCIHFLQVCQSSTINGAVEDEHEREREHEQEQ